MTKLNAKTLNEAATVLHDLMRWAPFKFSGRHYVVETKDGFAAFKTKTAAARQSKNQQCLIVKSH